MGFLKWLTGPDLFDTSILSPHANSTPDLRRKPVNLKAAEKKMAAKCQHAKRSRKSLRGQPRGR
jgi:hypothetical protein